MKARSGHEMRRFLVLVSVLVVLLIIGVIAFTTWDSVSRINDAAEREKESVIEQLVDYFAVSTEAATQLQFEKVIRDSLNPEMMGAFSQGDVLPLFEFMVTILRPLYVADYVTFVSAGEVQASSVEEGIKVSDAPTVLPEEKDELQYKILDEFAGEEGYYISIYNPMTMPGQEDSFLNFLLDRTAEIQAVDKVYEEERSSLITRQIIIGIIAIVIALLITTIGVYYLAKRYITGPIEAIADTSHQIMEGTYEGEVEVDEDSDYADLQRLLQSGKRIIDKMSML
jgi:hypothetical protein